MNRHRHRLIFNRRSGPGSSTVRARVPALRLALWLAWGLVTGAGVGMALPTHAQISAHRSAHGSQKPNVFTAPNGVPVVNIQTPSAAGVSRNLFSRFDVQRRGAVLNNSRTEAPSQLAGAVKANPWLARGSARVILSEVNSSHPSYLGGYVEVAGPRAEVVIANPAGITCDGCGFINIPRATLTTGTPSFVGPDFAGLRVGRGDLRVVGDGLDARQADFTALIAQAVRLDAEVHARHLSVIAGAQDIAFDGDGSIASITRHPPGNPASTPFVPVAIDVASLGGMYAGRIFLVGNGAGVGVRNAGYLNASGGDIVLTAGGRLENAGTLSARGSVRLEVQEAALNTGRVFARGNSTLTAGGDIDHLGVFVAGGDLKLSAMGAASALRASHDAVLAAGVQDDGRLGVTGRLDVTATASVTSQGQHVAGDAIDLRAGHLDLTGSQTHGSAIAFIASQGGVILAGAGASATRELMASAPGTVRTDGAHLQAKTLRLSAHGVSNRGGELRAGQSLVVASDGWIDNTQGLMSSGGALRLKASRLENGDAGSMEGGQVQIDADSLVNRGLIDGDGVDISAFTLRNLGSGRSFGDRVALHAHTLVNQGEEGASPAIAARERLDLGVHTLDNHENALIFSAGDLGIAGFLDDQRRAVGHAVEVRNASATLEALGRLRIAAREVVNTDLHFSTEVVGLPAQRLTELAGQGSPHRYASGSPGVYVYNDESDHLRTPEGTHEEWYRYEFTRNVSETRVVSAAPGRILSGGDIAFAADSVLNDKGHILAGGRLEVMGGSLTNIEAKGVRVTRDVGEVFTNWRDRHKGRDRSGIARSDYQPPERVETLTLSPSVARSQVAPAGGGGGAERRNIPNASSTQAPAPSLPPPGVRAGQIDPRLSFSSLMRVASDPGSRYLVETDPRFTRLRQWLGSDYLLDALALEPARLQKRLGGGFYEQRLVREQVMQLTGQRFLSDYSDDEAQFRALMDNGAAFARAHTLRPGVALSARQMAQLTSDMVWLVEQDVTLPDGRTVQALVPQLYARASEGDTPGGTALIAGRQVELTLSGDIVNSGRIQGREALVADVRNLHNLGGRMAGEQVVLRAQDDLNNLGGQVHADRRMVLDAGRDLRVASTTAHTANAQGARTALDQVASVEVSSPEGSLTLHAGHDVQATAASVRSEGLLGVRAGHDLHLDILNLSASEALEGDAHNYRRESQRSQAGSTLKAQGDLVLQAGNDLTARAASVTSTQGALVAFAGRDGVIAAGESRVQVDDAHRATSRGLLSRKTIDTRIRLDETTTQASTFSGRTTDVVAGRDIAVTGSQLVSDVGTHLEAGRDVTVQAATETRATLDERRTQRSGVFSSGGFGVTVGKQSQSSRQEHVTTTAARSTLGSVTGDVQILAGQSYRQVGSNVLAPQGSIAIDAQRVEVSEARETQRLVSATQTRQSGVTVSVSNPVTTAVQTVRRVREAARDANDPRMQALAALTQGLAIYEAGSAVADNPALAGGVTLSLSLGSSKSSSRSTQSSDFAAGSRVIAGGNVRVQAAGAGPQSDLVVQGSRVEAGGSVDLVAEDEVRLQAARSASSQRSESRQSSASVGISLGVGTTRPGLNVTAGASQARARTDGEDQTWATTQVSAGTSVDVQSGADTTLRGAVVQAPQVTARIGGNLVVESLQDTARYTSREKSVSAGASYGSSGFQAEASSSRGTADMHYANVAESSGMVAGDGGFNLNVQGRTELKAGQLASSDEAAAQGRNRLVTAALVTSDLENVASAQSSSSGFSVSSDMLTRGMYGATKAVVANTMLNASESNQATGQTKSAVSGGDIVITDEARQEALTGQPGAQAVATLSRDTRNAHVGVLRPDLDAMQRAVNAQRAIKQEAFRAVTVFTDESYRSRFETKPGLFKVSCRVGANCVSDPKQLVYTPATPEEIANAPAGAVLAVNGILNNEKRGSELAYQNADGSASPGETKPVKPEVVYLMHIAPARHTLSELMGVAYEKIVAESDYRMANFLGYTNGQALYADLLKSRGQSETLSLGHSRGTLVQLAAFTILANTKNENGEAYRNPKLMIRAVGGATDVESYTRKGLEILGRPNLGDQITFSYFSNDPVSTSSLAGANPGVSTLSDLWQVWKTSNSMHSCYGSGAPGCTQVEAPVPGGPQGTPGGNANLIKFVGGQRAPLQALQREGDQ